MALFADVTKNECINVQQRVHPVQCSAMTELANELLVIFSRKLTHPAARYLCDSWATCCDKSLRVSLNSGC